MLGAGLFPVSPGFPASNFGSNAKGRMGKIKLFPTTEYTSKQASDPVVPLVPRTGIFLGPSKSGKTVALISLILEQYRGVFERIYIFSPSVNIDDGWIPVKKYIEEDLGVNTEREQTCWDEWDEASSSSARSRRLPRKAGPVTWSASWMRRGSARRRWSAAQHRP